MFEAILSGIVIVTFLVVITQRVLVTAPDDDLSIRGYKILKGLDEQGLLRNYVLSENAAGLNSNIKFYAFNHTIEICREGGQCVGTRPNVTNLYSSAYIIAGNKTYAPYEVRLYIF